MKSLDLSGKWELCPVPEFPETIDGLSGWSTMDVPSHWQQHPDLKEHSGKMVYRKSFSSKKKKDTHYRLVLPGTFYWSTVFINGTKLGEHEGFFAPQTYDVTELVDADNEVVVFVDCPDEKVKNDKRMITGVFSHWDCLDPATNPGGLWLAPEIHSCQGAFFDQVLIHTESIEGEQAQLKIRIGITGFEQRPVRLKFSYKPDTFRGKAITFEEEAVLEEGQTSLEFTHTLDKPRLWWTHDLGSPDLYKVDIRLTDDSESALDRWQATIGIRTIEVEDWRFYVNGVPLFIKGNNYPPADTRIATVTREMVDKDLQLARECHMNMLRVHAHVSHPVLYEAADRAGVLLWQDFPLQWSYQREVLPIAKAQIVEMVHLLYNHPAIALWCCHNEPIYIVDTKNEDVASVARTAFSIFGWSWNRDVMDVQLADAVRAEDPSRFVNWCSGHPGIVRKGGDTHFYFGWYRTQGKKRYFDKVVKRTSHNLRFISEFGAQSLPNYESSIKFMDADIQKIDWDHLEKRHSLQTEILRYWVGLDQDSLATLIEESQQYQSDLNRYYIDRIRHKKYEPAGGTLPFMFTDPNPAIQWSIIDYWRVPKKSYYAMQKVFSPQYVFLLLDKDVYDVGDTVRFPLYLVNDARKRFENVTIVFALKGPDGTTLLERTVTLPLPADCTAIPVAEMRAPVTLPGTYRAELKLVLPDSELENPYTFEVSSK